MFLFLEMVIYNIFEIEIKNLQIEHHIIKNDSCDYAIETVLL